MNENKYKVMENMFLVAPGSMNHLRVSYNLINLLGDIAGVHGTIVGFFGIVFFSISKFCFTLSLIKKFYLIDTKDKKLFTEKASHPDKVPKYVEKYTAHYMEDVIPAENPNKVNYLENHHKLSLSTFQIIKIYLIRVVSCLTKSKHFKIYSEGK